MRRLIATGLLTLDGRTGAPQDWATRYFDDAAWEAARAALAGAGALLLGRGAYEYLAPSWSGRSGPYLDQVNAMPKWLFSDTLAEPAWHNTTAFPGDGVARVRELKAQDGGDLVLYGFGRFAGALAAAGLVDVFAVAVHPLLGRGGPSALGPGAPVALRCVGCELRESGVAMLTYVPEAA
jgi:dihydrofolate reductase